MFDAMNSPVVIGQTYGYTTSKGAFVTVVTGRARKLTEKKVTLDVISRARFLYGAPVDDDFISDQKHVSIHACHLFPIVTDAKRQAERIALGFDIQVNVSKALRGFDISLEQCEMIREAALDACFKHGLVPSDE